MKVTEEQSGIVSADTTSKRPWTLGPLELRTAQQEPYPNNRDGIIKFVRDCWDDTPEGDGQWGAIFSAEGSVTCTLGNGPTTHANGTLYCAAPELFEALADLVNGIQDLEDDGDIDVNAAEWLAPARAAMGKALGVDRG